MKKPPAVPMTIHLAVSGKTAETIRAIADAEYRTLVQMARLLIVEAIQAREAKSGESK